MSKDRNEDLMKKNGFYILSLVFWFFDNPIIF